MKRLIAFIMIVVIIVGWFIFSTVKGNNTTEIENSPEKIHKVSKNTD